MSVNEQMVQDVVKEVLAKLQLTAESTAQRGVFADMNEAIEAAKKAQKYIHECPWTRENKSSPTFVRKRAKMQKS